MRRILGFLLLALLPPLAFATNTAAAGGSDNAWTLYTEGNGPVMYQTLMAINGLMAATAFRTIMLTVACGGFFAMTIMFGVNPGQLGTKTVFYLITLLIILQITFNIKMNVAIMDATSNYYNVVTGVPMIVALPPTVSSTIGHWMTQQTEQFFNVPDGAKTSNSGYFNLSAQILSDADKPHINSPELRQSLGNYLQNCTQMDIALGRLTKDDLANSPDAMATLNTHNVSNLTVVTVDATGNALPAGPTTRDNLVSCADAYATLSGALGQWATTLSSAPNTLMGSVAMPTVGDRYQAAWAALQPSKGSGASTDAKTMIQQMALSELWLPATQQAAAVTGNDALSMSTANALQSRKQISTWVTTAMAANRFMGYLKTVLFAFLMGGTPFLVILCAIPGIGSKVGGMVLKLFVWLAMWEPFYAIINFFITAYGTSDIGTLGANGMTLGALPVISEKANTLLAVSMYLGASVPMITWGLVAGSLAFTSWVSNAFGEQLAAGVGGHVGEGSLSYANSSVGNTNWNKYDTSRTHATGDHGSDIYRIGKGSNGITTHDNYGGATAQLNGASVAQTKKDSHTDSKSTQAQQQEKLDAAVGYAKAIDESVMATDVEGHKMSEFYNTDHTRGSGYDTAYSKLTDNGKKTVREAGEVLSHTGAVEESKRTGEGMGGNVGVSGGVSAGGKGEDAASKFFSGMKGLIGGGIDNNLAHNINNGISRQAQHSDRTGTTDDSSQKFSVNHREGDRGSDTSSSGTQLSHNRDLQRQLSSSVSERNTLSDNWGKITSITDSYTSQDTVTSEVSYTDAPPVITGSSATGFHVETPHAGLSGDVASHIGNTRGVISDGHSARVGGYDSAIGTTSGNIDARSAGAHAGVGDGGGGATAAGGYQTGFRIEVLSHQEPIEMDSSIVKEGQQMRHDTASNQKMDLTVPMLRIDSATGKVTRDDVGQGAKAAPVFGTGYVVGGMINDSAPAAGQAMQGVFASIDIVKGWAGDKEAQDRARSWMKNKP